MSGYYFSPQVISLGIDVCFAASSKFCSSRQALHLSMPLLPITSFRQTFVLFVALSFKVCQFNQDEISMSGFCSPIAFWEMRKCPMVFCHFKPYLNSFSSFINYLFISLTIFFPFRCFFNNTKLKINQICWQRPKVI